ncbi:uroporphyrinogen decarboxylase [Niabella beijingensis]|uniref:uroporphyrinogen decarboxylase n=1 Tax=Niabella beijingensis TaxID=2872700 RepID=UPI001CC15D7A|nr:uroporphyrinogen decarboxylase [Niabella beijingensis]MBZ4191661.1 uroporphyrinogen decarboxylase [Niabella beijingensis]
MNDYIEYTGYLAMTLLVISFIPKRLGAIRIINFAGCVFFIAYGILLGWKWPIIISNGLIAIIQLYHLFVKKQSQTTDKRD